MSTTYPTRIRRAPRRFDPEDFVPGGNNKYTKGRMIDAGHDTYRESEDHEWRVEKMLHEKKDYEFHWLEESDEKVKVVSESEESDSESEEEEASDSDSWSCYSSDEDEHEENEKIVCYFTPRHENVDLDCSNKE